LTVRLRGDRVTQRDMTAPFTRCEGRQRCRGFPLPRVDERTRWVLAVRSCVARVLRGGLARLAADLSFRAGSGCGSSGWGCVLRTASASILCRSALVGAEDFVISCFLLNSRLPWASNRSPLGLSGRIPLCLETTILAAAVRRDENHRLSLPIRFNRRSPVAPTRSARSSRPPLVVHPTIANGSDSFVLMQNFRLA
jgi:hypothetical protein